jgi:CRISPR/Cas system-associated exonuclease Cas4 (RecB family)
MTSSLLKEIMLKKETTSSFKPAFDVSGISEKINSGYLANQDPKFMTKKTFAPSTLTYSAGNGVCPRYWYLAFEGAIFESYSTPFDIANMSSGTYSHSRIEKALLESGICVTYKKENAKTKELEDTTEFKVISAKPPIFGYGDCMLVWNGEEIVGEIKTQNNEAFEYRKRAGKPKKDHVAQTLIYMKVLGRSKGIIIYENKNNHELLLFPIEVNDHYRKWIDNTFEWMNSVSDAWKNKQLPIKNYRSNAKICKTCPVKKACDSAGDGIIKITSLEELSEAV